MPKTLHLNGNTMEDFLSDVDIRMKNTLAWSKSERVKRMTPLSA